MTPSPNEDLRPRCFVAMWFGSDEGSKDEMNQLFDLLIKPAVEKHGLLAYRVDRDPSVDKIDEAILAEIDRADLMVVDLTHDPDTGLRGSVVFEAGYGYRGKQVIWMCREDLVETIPFDLRQFRQIRWNPRKLLDARKALEEAVRLRLRERGEGRERHELWKEFSRVKKQIEEMKDLDDPNSGVKATADQLRFVVLEEFCEDIDTRLKYKEMGLNPEERYELIDMFRGIKKIAIDFLKQNNQIPGQDAYEKQVWSRLRTAGWMR